jgi:hypothetical protein
VEILIDLAIPVVLFAIPAVLVIGWSYSLFMLTMGRDTWPDRSHAGHNTTPANRQPMIGRPRPSSG